MSPFKCPFSWRGFGPLPYPTHGSLAHTSFPAAAAAAESVEFDDDVALLLNVAGLVMGPHVTSESEIGGTDSAALRTSWTCLRLR